MVFGLLGALLLSAAGLKLYGMNVAPFAQYAWFATPWVQFAAVAWEIVLGLWLLSGLHRAGAWLLATLTFLLFAGISFSLGWIGQAQCGCLGAIKASPWVAFTVDVGALGLLGVARPRFALAEVRQSFRVGVQWLGGVAALCIVLGVAATWAFGSLDRAIARLRGETLSVAPSYVDFGSAQPGDTLQTAVTISNWTDHPIRLIGGTSDCSCLTTADLPVRIEPGSHASVRVVLRPPGSSQGQLTRTVSVRTDDPNQPFIWFKVGCRTP